ncbi:MAG: uroporphyrinogen-III C-methyltransferase [Rhodospirillales bacterium]|nr:uroporphyrinogen-III C-methyltransferase [Rhodospirillales bacterium]
MSKGINVHLVGGGPGDPELLTVKAVRLLQEAEVVILDRLISEGILKLIPKGTSCIYAGKAPGRHYVSQDEINEMLVKVALSGRKVVRLKGGDPFVFGRGGEEALFLAEHGIQFEIIPGITAGMGCGSSLGIPLTHRGLAKSVRFVTGHSRNNGELDLNWKSLADPDTTLVIYMGLGTIGEVTSNLIAAGLPGDTPVAAVEKGSTEDERCCITTLSDLEGRVRVEGFKPPTLFIVGKVVTLAKQLNPALEDADGGLRIVG